MGITNAFVRRTVRHRNRAGFAQVSIIVGLALLALLASVITALPADAATATGPTVISHPGTAAPSPTTPAPPKGMSKLDNGFADGGANSQSAAVLNAATQARASKKPVPIDALTTETQQVTARPQGGFTVTANPLPVRTKKASGWVPVDTTLSKRSDGRYAPAATAYGTTSFSSGGNNPLAITSSGGTTYSVSWPGPLPPPAVSGSQATYANVLPGVDLVVSANAEGGFGEVLVLHSAVAANNPALAALRLTTVTTGGQARPGPEGGIIVAPAHGGDTLSASTPMMWDSNTQPTTPPNSSMKVAAGSKPDASDVAHPGLAAHVAVVGAQVAPTSLTLRPDTGMLTSSATVYPVYVDPIFTWTDHDSGTPAFDEVKQGAPCNHSPLFNNAGAAGDNGWLGVGVNAWDSCFGIMRAYYQWTLPSVLSGAQVNAAVIDVTKTYSGNCTGTTHVNLRWTGAINRDTDWNNQPYYPASTLGPSVAVGPALGFNCTGNKQPAVGLDVTSAIQDDANQGVGQFTVALSDDGAEAAHSSSGFARFADNPPLIIQLDHAPNPPSGPSAVTGSDNAGCATNDPYPYIGRTIEANTPVLNATLSDPDGNQLQATFTYWANDNSNAPQTGLSADNVASGNAASFRLPWTFVNNLHNDDLVHWQVQATDGALASPASSICTFRVEPDPPLKPVISSADGKYPFAAEGGQAISPSGTPGQFTIATPTPSTTNYVWALDQVPATNSPPASEVTAVTGVGGVAATPAGRWDLNSTSGTSAADTAGSHSAPLTGGAQWAADPVRGQTLKLNGTTGYAATTTPVISTTSSYSVSAWVNLTSTASYATALGQDGNSNSAFFLQYDAGDNRWSFAHTVGDGGTTPIHANSSAPPALNTWTHLAGTYDATSHTMTLYVNGVAQGTATDTAPFASTGPLSIGRSKYQGANADFFPGQISDVQAYQRVLTPAEIGSLDTATTITVTPQSPGPHSLYAYAQDAAGNISQTYDYTFMVLYDPSVTYGRLSDAFNNTAIGPDTGTAASANGPDWLSATDLTNAGWKPGSQITINGGTFTVPSFGTGNHDNAIAANQTINATDPALTAYNNTGSVTGSSSLMFLATTTDTPTANPTGTPSSMPGPILGNTTAPIVPEGTEVASTYCFNGVNPSAYCAPSGAITFTTPSGQTVQPYELTVPDWLNGPASLAAVVLPHEDTVNGQVSTLNPRIYEFSVPINSIYAGLKIASVTLPDVGIQVAGGVEALHIFAMTTRNVTTGTPQASGGTATAPSGQAWTGAWGQPTESDYNTLAGTNYSNQTVRIALTPTISGGTVRVKLDNALGTGPLTIGHATVAHGSPGPNGIASPPIPQGTPTTLSFGTGTSQSVTIPAGGMVYSNPLPFPVTAGQPLLVSFQLTNSVQYLPEHTLTSTTYEYISPTGSGDQTTDTTGNPFNTTGAHAGWLSNLLTNLDVTTSDAPTQAVLGDGMVDPWQPDSTADISQAGAQFADYLAAATMSTSTPTGTVDESIEANSVITDNPQTLAASGIGGPSALSRIDRDLLDQPNLGSVTINEGLEDVLAGANSDTLEQDGYTQLINDLAASNIAMQIVSLPPCDGYAGGGSTPNDPCTPTVDAHRTAINHWLGDDNPLGLNQATQPPLDYLDSDAATGLIDPTTPANCQTTDPSTCEIKLASAADTGDHVNSTPTGNAALATADLSAQDQWSLTEDPGDDTSADDTAKPQSLYWPFPNTTVGNNSLTTTDGTTWTTDSSRGSVLTLDGSKGSAASSGPVLSTTGSFTVAGWVKLTATGHSATIISEAGNHTSGFALRYDVTSNRWAFAIPASDTSGATLHQVTSASAPATGTWTFVAGTYNVSTGQLALYVNGTLAGTATDTATWAANGPLVIGSEQNATTSTNFLPGSLSDVSAFNYALTPTQIMALNQQIN
jgi:hypothetical protein